MRMEFYSDPFSAFPAYKGYQFRILRRTLAKIGKTRTDWQRGRQAMGLRIRCDATDGATTDKKIAGCQSI